ncbi:MAG: HD domain-containing protein [Alistipes sp.]|nr:HD domain-containing protein [Alistipes sp.]
MIRAEIVEYVEREILPRYEGFDAAHRRNHADVVIERSLTLARQLGVNVEMAYVVAAYHDTGLAVGRDVHHTESKRILLEDSVLKRWFTAEDIAVMGDAVEDHRASSKQPPRTIYGRIVAEADRLIVVESILRRTIQFTLSHHPELNREQGYERMLEHLREKYDYGGYLKLWIEESDNAKRLEELRQVIADKTKLRKLYEEIYYEEISKI